MDEIVRERYRRTAQLDNEINTLQISYRFAKREHERLQMAFGEIRTSRIGRIKLRYAHMMAEINEAIAEAEEEKNLYRGRHARDEEKGHEVRGPGGNAYHSGG